MDAHDIINSGDYHEFWRVKFNEVSFFSMRNLCARADGKMLLMPSEDVINMSSLVIVFWWY